MLTGPMTKRRSDATTAYDLLTDIRAYILEEPKRIFMGDWILKRNEVKRRLDSEAPVCGTVGCIAGNADVLTDGKVRWSHAERILSGDVPDLMRAFSGLFYNTDVPANYGTIEYARIVAGRITTFQKQHKAKLRQVVI